MSAVPSVGNGKVTVPSILERKSGISSQKNSPAKITCLTAYDYPTARLLDEAGVDVLLVGDSLAMVTLGYETTLPVTLEEMLHHTRAVRRGTHRALLVSDMPFGRYHDDPMVAVRDARAVEAAGAFSVVLESIPRELAARVTAEIRIPTIGIGAGPDCDGQILVINDLLGLSFGHKPKFTRRYADVGEMISRAAAEYCRDVQQGRFPSDEESYHLSAE